jgi:hypothetical protein
MDDLSCFLDADGTARARMRLRSQRHSVLGKFQQIFFVEYRLELSGQDSDVLRDFFLAHELKHVGSIVGRRFTSPLQEFHMHERITSLNRDGLSIVAEVDKLQGESSNVTAVNFCRV